MVTLAVACYIEDEETSNLIARYASLTKQTKTGALRELLREQVKRLEKPTPAERYRRTMEFLNANPPKRKITNAEVNGLYDYLDFSLSHGD